MADSPPQSEDPTVSPRLPSSRLREAPPPAPAPPSFVRGTSTTESGSMRVETNTSSTSGDAAPQTAVVDILPTSASSPLMLTSPITSKDWTFEGLMKSSQNFQEVLRVSCLDNAWVATAEDCERRGIPLIVGDWHLHRSWLEAFDADFLLHRHANDVVSVRNVGNFKDIEMTFSEFVDYSRSASPYSAEDAPLYAKDVECPTEWKEWFRSEALPSELQPHGCTDLLRHLPGPEQVETILCYYGIGGTFTPCHKDLCGSTGHNLMCHAENGSSFWFLTATDTAPKVATYFQETIGGELDWENHATTVEELRNAPFTVFVAEQKLGDLIIIPPRSCHQVVNHGGLTMKLSWSRMTMKGLTMGLLYELPVYRRVCRPEIYRVKSVLYHSLRYYSSELEDALHNPIEVGKRKGREIAILEVLFPLFERVLQEEFGESEHITYDSDHSSTSSVDDDETQSSTAGVRDQYTCDYCGADIFQSYFKCEADCMVPPNTDDRTGDALVICAACYVEGRSCKCGDMTPTQRHRTEALLDDRNKAALVLYHLHSPGFLQGHELSMSDLRASDDVSIFHAACVLHARRAVAEHQLKREQHSWTCRWNKEATHIVPRWSGVSCSQCHWSTCMTHLIETGVHASQAFLALEKTAWKTDPSPHWHQFHQRARFEVGHIQDALQSGKSVKLSAQFICAARSFRNSRSLNPRFTTAGFYDREVAPTEPIESAATIGQEDIKIDTNLTKLASRSQTPHCPDARCSPSPGCESPVSSLSSLSDSDSARADDSNILEQPPSRHTPMASPLPERPLAVCPSVPFRPPLALPRRNLAYVLAPTPSQQKRPVPEAIDDSPPSKKKKEMPEKYRFGPVRIHKSASRDTVRTVRQPTAKSVRAISSQLETDDETLKEDYADTLAGVMQRAWDLPRIESTRAIASPASHSVPPPPQAAHEAERGHRERSEAHTLPPPSPQCDVNDETTFPHAVAPIPTPLKPHAVLGATVPTSRQDTLTAVRSAEPHVAKGSAHVRAPRGRPPGKPATAGHSEYREQSNHIRQSKIAMKAAQASNHLHFRRTGETQRITELEEKVRELERDKAAANLRLEDAAQGLAAASAECETLRRTYEDYRRTAEEKKAGLEESVARAEQYMNKASEKLELKDLTIKEQLMQISSQREELSKQRGELERRQGELSYLQENLRWVATEFENHLRHGNSVRAPAGYQQDMPSDAMCQQLRQGIGEILRRLPVPEQVQDIVGENSRTPRENNAQKFIQSLALPAGTAFITSHTNYYNGTDVPQAGQSQGPSRSSISSSPRHDGNWPRDSRGYTNHDRSDLHDPHPRPPHPLHPRRGRLYSPSGRSDDVRQWVTDSGSRSRRDWSRNCTPPLSGRDTPQFIPNSAHRANAGSRRDDRRVGSPVSRRAASVSTQVPSSQSEMWEDTYGREERVDRKLSGPTGSRTVVSTSRSGSAYSPSVSDADRYARRNTATPPPRYH